MRIQSNPEQQDAALNFTREGYVCFRYRRLTPDDPDYDLRGEATRERPWIENWTWDIIRKFDYRIEAQRWFDACDGRVRVWFVTRGMVELTYAK